MKIINNLKKIKAKKIVENKKISLEYQELTNKSKNKNILSTNYDRQNSNFNINDINTNNNVNSNNLKYN